MLLTITSRFFPGGAENGTDAKAVLSTSNTKLKASSPPQKVTIEKVPLHAHDDEDMDDDDDDDDVKGVATT